MCFGFVHTDWNDTIYYNIIFFTRYKLGNGSDMIDVKMLSERDIVWYVSLTIVGVGGFIFSIPTWWWYLIFHEAVAIFIENQNINNFSARTLCNLYSAIRCVEVSPSTR